MAHFKDVFKGVLAHGSPCRHELGGWPGRELDITAVAASEENRRVLAGFLGYEITNICGIVRAYPDGPPSPGEKLRVIEKLTFETTNPQLTRMETIVTADGSGFQLLSSQEEAMRLRTATASGRVLDWAAEALRRHIGQQT